MSDSASQAPVWAWASDIHLDFVDALAQQRLCRELRESGAEALLLGGDIAVADTVVASLRAIADGIDMPVYFVLGNHDYYGGSVAAVHRAMEGLRHPSLCWLEQSEGVELGGGVGLVGVGGWGDLRLGACDTTPVVLRDYVAIDELSRAAGSRDLGPRWPDRPELQRVVRALADDAAARFERRLLDALQRFARVVVLTHVPPFREACWHEGQISNDDWLPGFTCKAVGDVLERAVAQHPERELLVLTGHTHGEGVARLGPSLVAWTFGAEYGAPRFERIHAPAAAESAAADPRAWPFPS